MISRLTTYAALFAVLTTATLAIATAAPQAPSAAPIVQLETVVVTGHRITNDQR